MAGMTPLSIILEGDGAFEDLGTDFISGELEAVAALPNGTAKGRPAVALRIKLPDGQTVIAQTTLRLFMAAARGFDARYPDNDPRS